MTKPQAWITHGGPLYKLLIRINLYIMLALESELIDLTVMDKYQQNKGVLGSQRYYEFINWSDLSIVDLMVSIRRKIFFSLVKGLSVFNKLNMPGNFLQKFFLQILIFIIQYVYIYVYMHVYYWYTCIF